MSEPRTPADFIALFRALAKTNDVDERLVILGIATRGADGALVLRDDVRVPFEDLVARLQASLAAGLSQREAVEAAALDVDPRKTTFALYGLFLRAELAEKYGDGAFRGLYIDGSGENESLAARLRRHPAAGGPLLTAAMKSTGGKKNWTHAVLFVLPEDARADELVTHLTTRLQRLLGTVPRGWA